MANVNYNYTETDNVPIKHWTKGVQLEDQAHEQLKNIASLPFIHKHVAAMPDVHWGMGATIGSVIATKGAIVPAAVGVDIGCGMMAVKTSLTASDLPDNLQSIRWDIEAAVPHGRTDNGGKNDKGGWGHDSLPAIVNKAWNKLAGDYLQLIIKHPKAKAFNTWHQLGTLGTGNHWLLFYQW